MILCSRNNLNTGFTDELLSNNLSRPRYTYKLVYQNKASMSLELIDIVHEMLAGNWLVQFVSNWH
jgi:hypothetical protein